MPLLDILKALLSECGTEFAEKNAAVQLVMCRRGHKWNVAFTEDDQGYLRYYARYPWAIPDGAMQRALREVNSLNEDLRAGSFFISGGFVVFRLGAYIFDEFIARESVCDLFVTAAAKTDAEWDRIYGCLFSGDN